MIVDGSLEGEVSYRCTLATLAEELRLHEVRPPAIIVVGEVAGLPQVLARS